MSKRENWVWMPHPGHLIVASRCRYHLNTYVGGYIVSTVGEWFKNDTDEEPTEIGVGRLYETYVFPAKRNKEPEYQCCKWEISDFFEIDSLGTSDRNEAYTNHMKLCKKWAEKSTKPIKTEE